MQSIYNDTMVAMAQDPAASAAVAVVPTLYSLDSSLYTSYCCCILAIVVIKPRKSITVLLCRCMYMYYINVVSL